MRIFLFPRVGSCWKQRSLVEELTSADQFGWVTLLSFMKICAGSIFSLILLLFQFFLQFTCLLWEKPIQRPVIYFWTMWFRGVLSTQDLHFNFTESTTGTQRTTSIVLLVTWHKYEETNIPTENVWTLGLGWIKNNKGSGAMPPYNTCNDI